MNKISWCKKQSNGIKLIEPNENLSEEYYQNAEESLKVLRSIEGTKSNMWLATTKYYIEYFAIYSVLMKIGVKCEIHDCTIALTKFLEEENVVKQGMSEILEKDKELRIENQYYLKNKPVDINFENLSEFMVSIKETLDKIGSDKIEELRGKIEDIELTEDKG